MKAKVNAAQLVLRNPKGELSSLTVEYRDPEGRFKRVATGVQVVNRKNAKGEFIYWDGVTIKANGSKDPKNDTKSARETLADVNRVIDNLERQLKRWPMVNEVTAAMKSEAAPVAQEEKPLVDILEEFITTRTGWQPASRKSFTTLLHNIKAYQEAEDITWTLLTLTNSEIKKFQHWMLETYDYRNSTSGKRTRLLRQFLAEHPAPGVNLTKVKPLHTQLLTAPVVLEQTEIEALRTLPLDPKSRLGKVRNLQVLQIFTGLRVSDLMCLDWHHIRSNEIEIREQKTKRTRYIPLLEPAREVLKLYTDADGMLRLPSISPQKFNDYIGELAQQYLTDSKGKAKMVFVTRKHRESVLEEWQPKHEHITSHTSRRSFCSLLLSLGYSVRDTMALSGHRSLAAFQRYVGLVESRADLAQDINARYQASLKQSVTTT
ncbi:tyrosine-type recombinase/integrase [Hymenobacter latericus]|uniref:tyrosine-type recombinase/integrase n=1 Tax=Hymenobacter sp. YIM 151858-1 TaxID=2987688 RepID=UPI002225CF21|nr:tyrosine-type recombinase/integrase [Hymenobacter sp. YIM 151858-1]UYZ58443.1 tyrosine-type recombinase/integrase [Hymenobacter sp. YIM 151858-1]